jgi:serine/threonine protein kinase
MPTQKSEMSSDQILSFLRKRDYRFIRELGQGACGQTVLLHDDVIDQAFVCKKYVPFDERQRPELFAAFVREIKLLHQLLHPNVVRFFNHFIYPEQFAGYILMEFVDGQTIDDYVLDKPEQINDLFIQAIDGFTYLQQQGILHRDIRPQNLMVTSGGRLKIIDLGFGKRITHSADFEKSVTLNWWCEIPADFSQLRYDFSTEVYFVGKLFERLIQENAIQSFKYASQLRSMCHLDPLNRDSSFSSIDISIGTDRFAEVFLEARR